MRSDEAINKNEDAIGLIVISLILGQCTTKNTTDSGATKDEDYKSFITRFNSDTIFQKTRIKYRFDHNLNLSLSTIDTKLFDISTHVGDSVTVKITLRENTSYWIEYIFKKERGDWYLTDYIDTYDD